MVDVLLPHLELPARAVELAVRGALAAGAHDGRAVALSLAAANGLPRPRWRSRSAWLGFGNPPPTDISGYDKLRQVG
jgi:hypothetical protein